MSASERATADYIAQQITACDGEQIEEALPSTVVDVDGPTELAKEGKPVEVRAPGSPAEILERSRVDVIGRIRDGIPEREYVPGALGLFPKGKRTHIAAERKVGKSLSIAVVTAVQIVAAGGTVVVLDRENGADEYARRLQEVLKARNADDTFRERVRERLHYHHWPMLSLGWREGYAEAFAGADLVIFDSSRSHLAPLGLKEDLSDDFAAFTTALIDPLMQAGITTVILDNVGHVEKDRPRGSSSKADLCDCVFTMKTLAPFSSTLAGRLELRCTDSRIGEVSGAWQMKLGDGRYGTWQKVGARPPEARDELREAALDVLAAADEVMGVNKIGKAIRERPGNALKFGDRDLRSGLAAWAADPTSGVLPDPAEKGYVSHGKTACHGPHGENPAPQLAMDPPATADMPASTGDMPMADDAATARHGGHGGSGVSRRDATPRHAGSENGHDDLGEGWSVDDLEAIAAEFEEAAG
jgi:AAA domain